MTFIDYLGYKSECVACVAIVVKTRTCFVPTKQHMLPLLEKEKQGSESVYDLCWTGTVTILFLRDFCFTTHPNVQRIDSQRSGLWPTVTHLFIPITAKWLALGTDYGDDVTQQTSR